MDILRSYFIFKPFCLVARGTVLLVGSTRLPSVRELHSHQVASQTALGNMSKESAICRLELLHTHLCVCLLV